MISTIQNIDIFILNFVNANFHNPILDRIMLLFTYMGNWGLVWIVISIFLMLSKKYRRAGFILISAVILASILGEGIIKHLIQRARPCEDIPAVNLLINKPLSYSFPSGHTAASFASAGVFMQELKKYRVHIVALALSIALSRLYLYVHYPSDIIGGMLLGLFSSKIVLMLYKSNASKVSLQQ